MILDKNRVCHPKASLGRREIWVEFDGAFVIKNGFGLVLPSYMVLASHAVSLQGFERRSASLLQRNVIPVYRAE